MSDDEREREERPSLFKDPAAGRGPYEPPGPDFEKAPSGTQGWAPPIRGRGPDTAPEAPSPQQHGGWAPPPGATPGGYAPMPSAPAPDTGWRAQPGPGGGPIYELADYGDRVAAALVDFLIRLGIVLTLAAVGALGFLISDDTGVVGLISFAIVGYILGAFVYAPVMMSRTDGRTVGHRTAGTRIVNADGRRMTGGKAFVREVLVKNLMFESLGSFLFFIPTLLNVLFPLWDDGNEALHDKICQTRVVKDR